MAFDVEDGARGFSDELSDLLNGTVCHGIRLRSVASPPSKDSPARANVEYKIGASDIEPTVGIPITLGRKAATGYLELSFRLSADEFDRYLMVTSSVMAYHADADLSQLLLHYDYERDKGGGYPEAHLQVCGDSPGWAAICARQGWPKRPFRKLHLPVGGRAA